MSGPFVKPDAVAARDHGFALVVVLLALTAIGGAFVSFSATLRSHAREAAAAVARAEAESLADAGVNLAILDLLTAREDRRYRRRFALNGGPVTCASGEHAIEITVADETGRLDLNAAGEDLLVALFAGAGASPFEARRMAHAVIDYRDKDSTAHAQGAEAEDYRRAGLTHGPRNAPFLAPEEIGRVLGMDARILDRIAPHLTVHSGRAGIDPDSASPALLALLLRTDREPSQSQAEAGEIRREFRRRMPQHVAVPGRQIFAVRATAVGRGAIFVREAVLETGTSRSRTHAVRSWRQGSALPGTTANPASADPC